MAKRREKGGKTKSSIATRKKLEKVPLNQEGEKAEELIEQKNKLRKRGTQTWT